jgi:hypothetical protein
MELRRSFPWGKNGVMNAIFLRGNCVATNNQVEMTTLLEGFKLNKSLNIRSNKFEGD